MVHFAEAILDLKYQSTLILNFDAGEIYKRSWTGTYRSGSVRIVTVVQNGVRGTTRCLGPVARHARPAQGCCRGGRQVFGTAVCMIGASHNRV